tara:strand:+ start:66 stop:653 length:588 start_codon:yes stop_codon:yes gene_type:complete
MKCNNSIYKFNLKDEISPIRDRIISEASKKKYLASYNFPISTEFDSYLYDIFIKKCESLFDFELFDQDFQLWCMYNDKSYLGGNNKWHNHVKGSSINGVLYLKTIEGCGLKYCEKFEIDQIDIEPEDFEMYEKGKIIQYIEPKDFDLYIFPDYMMHTPVFTADKIKDEIRVSLNLEIKCIENSIDIFNTKKINYF